MVIALRVELQIGSIPTAVKVFHLLFVQMMEYDVCAKRRHKKRSFTASRSFLGYLFWVLFHQGGVVDDNCRESVTLLTSDSRFLLKNTKQNRTEQICHVHEIAEQRETFKRAKSGFFSYLFAKEQNLTSEQLPKLTFQVS